MCSQSGEPLPQENSCIFLFLVGPGSPGLSGGFLGPYNQAHPQERHQCSLAPSMNIVLFRFQNKWMKDEMKWIRARNDFGHWMNIGRNSWKKMWVRISGFFVRSVIQQLCDLRLLFTEPQVPHGSAFLWSIRIKWTKTHEKSFVKCKVLYKYYYFYFVTNNMKNVLRERWYLRKTPERLNYPPIGDPGLWMDREN